MDGETKVVMRAKNNMRTKVHNNVPPPLPARNKSSAFKSADMEHIELPEKKTKHISADLANKAEEPM